MSESESEFKVWETIPVGDDLGSLDYVLDRENPLFARLQAFLAK